MDAGKEKLEKKAAIDRNTKVHIKEMKILSVQLSATVTFVVVVMMPPLHCFVA
jgi:archaellum biogenesis protein FlaJ (TadC family)